MNTSLPRPVLIALVGVAAVGAMFVMTRGKGNGGGEAAPAPPSASSAPKASVPAKSSSTASADSGAKPSPRQRQHAKRSASGRPGAGTRSRTLPRPVKRALDAHKVVVLLFWSRRGTDDRSVKSAVDSLSRRGGKVAVFTDRSKNAARYTKITTAAAVEQTPTLVVVNRHGQARTATGYLDRETVEQYVVDALHGAP